MAIYDDSRQDDRIYQKTVVAQVMERIKELITSGLYKVGDRIPTEQELADRFGIGRSSIREAIKIFQYLGILESRVPKGTFLCARSQISTEAITWALLLGDDDMWEIIELREVIEERAFQRLVRSSDEASESLGAVLDALDREVANMRAAVAEASVEKLIQADYNFHAAIIREGGNALFWAIFQTLHSFMREEIRKTFTAIDDLLDVARDHQEMVDMLRSGDADKAASRHGEHFVRIKNLLNPTQGKLV